MNKEITVYVQEDPDTGEIYIEYISINFDGLFFNGLDFEFFIPENNNIQDINNIQFLATFTYNRRRVLRTNNFTELSNTLSEYNITRLDEGQIEFDLEVRDEEDFLENEQIQLDSMVALRLPNFGRNYNNDLNSVEIFTRRFFNILYERLEQEQDNIFAAMGNAAANYGGRRRGRGRRTRKTSRRRRSGRRRRRIN